MSHPREWDAATYHAVSAPQVAWGSRVLERLPLRGDEVALDVGCGTGRLTARLLERLPHGRVIALDLSAQMVARARRELAFAGDRVRVLRGDIHSFRVDAPVDVIVSTAALHWIPRHGRLFHHLHGLLVPGGLLAAQCGGRGNLRAWLRHTRAIMAEPRYAPHFRDWRGPWTFASAEATAARLRRAGFEDVSTWLHDEPTFFDSRESLSDFLWTVILRSHLAQLPQSARGPFAEEVRERARSHGLVALDYVRLNLEARKPR